MPGLHTIRLFVEPMGEPPLGLPEAETAAKEGVTPIMAVYADVPRPSQLGRDNLARFAVLAAYGPDDAIQDALVAPDMLSICYSLDGQPWCVAGIVDPYRDKLGELRVVRDGSLRAPSLALPAGERSTRAAMVWNGASQALAPFCLTTCGISPEGKLLHSVPAAGLTRQEMIELGLGNIPIAVME
jgi:hypothetical protein